MKRTAAALVLVFWSWPALADGWVLVMPPINEGMLNAIQRGGQSEYGRTDDGRPTISADDVFAGAVLERMQAAGTNKQRVRIFLDAVIEFDKPVQYWNFLSGHDTAHTCNAALYDALQARHRPWGEPVSPFVHHMHVEQVGASRCVPADVYYQPKD